MALSFDGILICGGESSRFGIKLMVHTSTRITEAYFELL
ncbi:hypothetical protein SPWS13_2613 [Shewanella putrefaciens]|nr:hypothetical protein SPWS13_2613 [Shewanella putrefaciens]